MISQRSASDLDPDKQRQSADGNCDDTQDSTCEELDSGDVHLIAAHLRDICEILQGANWMIAQQTQTAMPVTKRFNTSCSPDDPYPGLFQMLSYWSVYLTQRLHLPVSLRLFCCVDSLPVHSSAIATHAATLSLAVAASDQHRPTYVHWVNFKHYFPSLKFHQKIQLLLISCE